MLKGIRVIDFTQYLPGPYATLRLADMGAEVIKVEAPTGDLARTPLEQDGEDGYLSRAQNRGKKSIVLNLKEVEDQKVAIELMRNADVVIESFRPGVTDRLGIGYRDCKQIKPNIIYCSLSGFGQDGTLHSFGSHDLNYMAISGVLSQLKDQDNKPIHPKIQFADLIGGISASESIIAALLQRERTGEGAYLDIALNDVMVSLMINHVLIESATGQQDGIEFLNDNMICYSLYETKDQRFISLAALEKKFWKEFCHALGKEEWIDAQFTAPHDTNPVYLEVKQAFKERTFAEWSDFSLRVDCCMAPVLETSEMVRHPQVVDRKLIQEKWGLRHTATRYEQNDTIFEQTTAYPKKGEHTETVRKHLRASDSIL